MIIGSLKRSFFSLELWRWPVNRTVKQDFVRYWSLRVGPQRWLVLGWHWI